MDEKEPLQKLEEQVDRLTAQLKEQYTELQQMRDQLQNLNPAYRRMEAATQPSKPRPTFALGSSSLENLIGLRLIHLVGIVVLVIGLSLG